MSTVDLSVFCRKQYLPASYPGDWAELFNSDGSHIDIILVILMVIVLIDRWHDGRINHSSLFLWEQQAFFSNICKENRWTVSFQACRQKLKQVKPMTKPDVTKLQP